MSIEKYFDINIDSKLLFARSSNVVKGEHGITIDSEGNHHATAYHIYKGRGLVLAKPEIKMFLLEKFPDNSDLVNEYKKSNQIEEEVEYEGQGFSIKKVKLEWIVDLFEKENNLTKESFFEEKMSSTYSLNKLNVESEVLPLLNKISEFKIYENSSSSNEVLIESILNLIKKNHDEFKILVLVYFPVIFEKVCKNLESNSERFKKIVEDYMDFKGLGDKEKNNTSYDYICILKYSKRDRHINKNVSIELFKYFSQVNLEKKFSDVYHFLKLRNDLVHNNYIVENDIEIINLSRQFLTLIIDVLEDFN